MSRELLKPGCSCGHKHETSRGQSVDLCLADGCDCSGYDMRCQNCGEGFGLHRTYGREKFWACSTACANQIIYYLQLQGVAV